MRKKTVILTGILGVAIFLSVFAINVTAGNDTQGAFNTNKSDRSLLKDVIVGQKEIKALLQQLNKKIDGARICK